jgi:protein-S-isoprenylcysteine O-methyltransferase Ste14
MLIIRIYLLLGLVLHKVVWEALRKRSSEPDTPAPRSLMLTGIKTVKILILLGVLVQTMIPEIFPISSDPFALRVAGVAIYSLGLITALAARFQLGDNWSNIETGQVLERQEVVAKGVYSFIRHPIYTGDLLLLVGLELALNSWLVVAAVLLVPIVMSKAIKEEKMLRDELPGYDNYCAGTKRFIPFVI